MDSIIITPLIQYLQRLPVELTSVILFLVCVTTILILLKLFGQNGIHLYSIVAILVANIQVFKLVTLSFYPHPVALGTIVFASTYLCSGILTEHYGKDAANQNIWFGFTAQIIFVIFMLITLGHKPLIYTKNFVCDNNFDCYGSYNNYTNSMELIFTPLPRLLFASLFSFVISQKIGIHIFNFLKIFTINKYLWLRTVGLIFIATCCDTFLFNILAWGVLSPTPISFISIFNTYILITLITQFLVTLMSTPILYFSYKLKPIQNLNLINKPS